MRATTLHAPFDIRIGEVPDTGLQDPTDALVRVTASCICGSDLWPYRGQNPVPRPRRIGHEFVGVVEAVGSEVSTVRPGQFVVAPFTFSDGTCPSCQAGVQSACDNGSAWGARGFDGAQAEALRVPFADGTLVATPTVPDDDLVASLLTLSDVMGTGWHAAVSAGVRPGQTVVVVGDGAVGLCGVLAAASMGAERVVVMSRHAPRQALARDFGATDVVAERGEGAVAAVRELTGGVGAGAVLECVGTAESMTTAVDCARPGAAVGYVGVPHDVVLPIETMFRRNISISGGVAPVRRYLPDLMTRVLDGDIDPGRVFDQVLPLDDVAEGYTAMHERRAIKTLLRP
jgi:threonine dehydrogenase-like Zn-dependent dehydrogenase